MSDNHDKHWKYLLEKYMSNASTREELDQLLKLLDENQETEAISEALNSYWRKAAGQQFHSSINATSTFNELMQESRTKVPPALLPLHKRRTPAKLLAAAAIAAVFLIGAAYFFFASRTPEMPLGSIQEVSEPFNNDVAPGYSGAVLTLSNGEKIVLDSAGNGNLARQGSANVIKRNGELTYTSGGGHDNRMLYNTMSTPRGRQYQLVLADGTKVWLNAASSITYPTVFSDKDRTVTMTGEAYFEVAKNAAKPFKVIVNDAEVAVLGTHFNINAYADEHQMQTTLIEGSVKISKGKKSDLLVPGQQAQLSDNGIKIIKDADIELALAWKNGFTSFKSAGIKNIMRQVERWYDVQVTYEGNIPERSFTGDISRNANLSQLLRLLEVSKIHFKINGNNLTVTP